MTDWAKVLRNFLQEHSTEWTCRDPPYQKLRWPYRVSQNWLKNEARRGQCLIWTELRDTPAPRIETEGSGAVVLTAKTYVKCTCYARAMTDSEEDVERAVTRAGNMRDQIAKLVMLYTAQFPGAYHAIPAGHTPLTSWEIRPGFSAVVLVIEFEHPEDATGAL